MSRVGKTPIPVPKGVQLKMDSGKVTVTGPKGTLETLVPKEVTLSIEQDVATVHLDEKSNMPSARHGLYRSLIANAVSGVSTGFEKKLSLVGVGFRANLKGNILELALGFSHPCNVEIPKGITVSVEKSILIIISGIDKALVGQFAASIRKLRSPEPYKGKGVRYQDEVVRKKAGKAAKGK